MANEDANPATVSPSKVHTVDATVQFTAEDAREIAKELHSELQLINHWYPPPSAERVRAALPELVKWLGDLVNANRVTRIEADLVIREIAGLALERQIAECLESSIVSILKPEAMARQIALWHERSHAG